MFVHVYRYKRIKNVFFRAKDYSPSKVEGKEALMVKPLSRPRADVSCIKFEEESKTKRLS